VLVRLIASHSPLGERRATARRTATATNGIRGHVRRRRRHGQPTTASVSAITRHSARRGSALVVARRPARGRRLLGRRLRRRPPRSGGLVAAWPSAPSAARPTQGARCSSRAITSHRHHGVEDSLPCGSMALDIVPYGGGCHMYPCDIVPYEPRERPQRLASATGGRLLPGGKQRAPESLRHPGARCSSRAVTAVIACGGARGLGLGRLRGLPLVQGEAAGARVDPPGGGPGGQATAAAAAAPGSGCGSPWRRGRAASTPSRAA